MRDVTRHEARQHLLGYAALGLLIALLVVAHAYNRELHDEAQARATAAKWSYQAAQSYETITQLEMQRDVLQVQLDELSAMALDLIGGPLVNRPCVEADPVPVFSRDSQFHATP